MWKRLISGCALLFAITSAYVWNVGQTGVSTFNHNLCELLRRHGPIPDECNIDNWILVLWAVLATTAVLFLIYQVVAFGIRALGFGTRYVQEQKKDSDEDNRLGAKEQTSATPVEPKDTDEEEQLLLFQKRLVVQMRCQAPNLDSDNVLYINVNVKNVNQDPANLIAIRGNILCSWDMRQERRGIPELPYLKNQTINHIPSGSDFNFTIAQELPPQLVKDWQGKTLYLFFTKLDIVVQSAANSNISVRLPLWEAVWVNREGNRIRCGEIRSIGLDFSNLPIKQ